MRQLVLISRCINSGDTFNFLQSVLLSGHNFSVLENNTTILVLLSQKHRNCYMYSSLLRILDIQVMGKLLFLPPKDILNPSKHLSLHALCPFLYNIHLHQVQPSTNLESSSHILVPFFLRNKHYYPLRNQSNVSQSPAQFNSSLS